MNKIQVIICGAAGKMGRSIIKGIAAEPDLNIIGAVDLISNGEDAGVLAGVKPLGITVTSDLRAILADREADVLIDFTAPASVMDNVRCALQHKVVPVVGTTGIGEAELNTISGWVDSFNTGAIIAPNYAIGAVLMMKAAQLFAAYLPDVEIIEMHHDEKLDAPSGTARKLAALIRSATGQTQPAKEELEIFPGVRGGRVAGIPVHSIRLPGLMAHHAVVFGSAGQLLTIRHDTLDRDCYIPGVLLAVRSAPGKKELIYGMDKLLQLSIK
ncbi:MAG: 4-hydroxy-tetrahydrodipicolinate reductase [Dethiobacter sp.]|jgi:4-hydroxy-tetrahydrodipicolinate reductase|nr:4-hydroxy-tetrahydrodipicolinate reductase [Dethiobacter sp.]